MRDAGPPDRFKLVAHTALHGWLVREEFERLAMSGPTRFGLFVEYCAKDFLDGTQLLDPWEELAYRRICDMIYATNDTLPDNDKKLAWMTKTGKRWPLIKASLTTGDRPKLIVIDGRITNQRCQFALAKAAKNIAQKAMAGKSSVDKGKALENLERARTAVDRTVATAVTTASTTNLESKNPIKKDNPSATLQDLSETPTRKMTLRGIAEQMAQSWNSICCDPARANARSRVKKLTDSRIRAAAARFQDTLESSFDQWDAVCRRVVSSSFLMGGSESYGGAGFDFVINQAKLVCILEGKYDDRINGHGAKGHGRAEEAQQADETEAKRSSDRLAIVLARQAERAERHIRTDS